jgi:DNA-binding XRE family transcriptional regulator
VLRIHPDIAGLLARQGASIADFAERAGVARQTIFALLNPAQHPERRGGMHRTTAWKLARAYAQLTGLSEDAAYAAIIVEAPASDAG